MLSEDQESARTLVSESLLSGRRCSVLAGPAGSGKTTLLRTIAEDLRSAGRGVVVLAPTGKAALNAAKKTGWPAKTIHSALFRYVQEDADGNPTFGKPGPPCEPGEVVLVDEASMVGEELHNVLLGQLPWGSQILYCGDREQLPPVNDRWGPDFKHPTAVLTEVHRQALGSPIIRLATAIRTSSPGWTFRDVAGRDVWDGKALTIRQSNRSVAASWLAGIRSRGGDGTLITWRNKVRQDLNWRTRSARGIDPESMPGDEDILICLKNNYSLPMMNGETLRVLSCGRVDFGPFPAALVDMWGDGRNAWIRPDLMGCDSKTWMTFAKSLRKYREGGGEDPSERWLWADYGECLTVHKSQGSEYADVGFYVDGAVKYIARENPEDWRRLAYTAVTRASERLVVFEGS